MKKMRMNISHFCFILFNLKIFGEIVTTFFNLVRAQESLAILVLIAAMFLSRLNFCL